MSESDEKLVRQLLFWLAAYALGVVCVSWASGKLAEAIPVLTNIASGLFGATMMLIKQKP
jgi:TctA family transporter